jgi:hypothetical protein
VPLFLQFTPDKSAGDRGWRLVGVDIARCPSVSEAIYGCFERVRYCHIYTLVRPAADGVIRRLA